MNVAVIGLGNIGKLHKYVLEKLGITVKAICDIEVKKAIGYSGKFYTDYREMLDNEDIDAVHICTPHYLHAEMIIRALENGINVLCEKPLCIELKDIPRIINAEKNSRAILGVCHQNRFNEVNVFTKKYIEDKKIISAHGTLVWRRDAEYYASGSWRGKKSTEGGGVLINQALHTLDLMQWLCGMPKAVSASVGNLSLKGIIETEDTASLYCEGTNDFTFFATNAGKADMPAEMEFMLDNGETLNVFPDKLLINGEKAIGEDLACENRKNCYGNGHEKLIKSFYSCVADKRRFEIDGEEGSKAVKIILAAYASGGNRKEIN